MAGYQQPIKVGYTLKKEYKKTHTVMTNKRKCTNTEQIITEKEHQKTTRSGHTTKFCSK